MTSSSPGALPFHNVVKTASRFNLRRINFPDGGMPQIPYNNSLLNLLSILCKLSQHSVNSTFTISAAMAMFFERPIMKPISWLPSDIFLDQCLCMQITCACSSTVERLCYIDLVIYFMMQLSDACKFHIYQYFTLYSWLASQ